MPKNITSVEWQASDIPSGLAFDTATGTFSGTPAGVGEYTVPVTVTTNYGTDTKDVMVKTSERVIADTTGKLYITECVDDGNDIIFFGNYQNGNIGIYFKYNPTTKVKSETFKLVDGEVLTSADIDNMEKSSRFYTSAFDPVSKKWIAFFDGGRVRTQDGVKDLHSQIVTGNSALCWSDTLQRFCAIVWGNSYIFDIDGNFIDKSKQLGEIENFTRHTKALSWSNTAGVFVAASTNVISSSYPYKVVAYSSDGLNWNSSMIYHNTNHTKTDSLITSSSGTFILTTTGMPAGMENERTPETAIYTSTNGINWGHNKNHIISGAPISAAAGSNGNTKTYIATTMCTNKSYIGVYYDDKTYMSGWRSLASVKGTEGCLLEVKKDVYDDNGITHLSPVKMIYSDTFKTLAIPALYEEFFLQKL